MTEPNLRFPAVSCKNLRFSAVSWGTDFLPLLAGESQSIYLHCSGPLLENGLDRPKNRYGRYDFPGFSSLSISTVGVDEARVFL